MCNHRGCCSITSCKRWGEIYFDIERWWMDRRTLCSYLARGNWLDDDVIKVKSIFSFIFISRSRRNIFLSLICHDTRLRTRAILFCFYPARTILLPSSEMNMKMLNFRFLFRLRFLCLWGPFLNIMLMRKWAFKHADESSVISGWYSSRESNPTSFLSNFPGGEEEIIKIFQKIKWR